MSSSVVWLTKCVLEGGEASSMSHSPARAGLLHDAIVLAVAAGTVADKYGEHIRGDAG